MPGAAFSGDYDWVREYLGTVRLDDTGGTFLFRFADDGTVRFHDLNTKLGMRKRKRAATDEDGEGDGAVLQPEKVSCCSLLLCDCLYEVRELRQHCCG